jgi:hypothetical protein
VLHLPVPLLEAQVEDGLDAIPEITGDQGRMVAAVCPAVPLEETDVLLGKVDLDVEFVDRDPVTEVPVQTVGLLDKDGPAR